MIASNSERRQASILSAVMPVIDNLEQRQLFGADTVQSLPFVLDFNSNQGELLDKDGTGIGLTRTQANSAGNQYQPNLIDLDTTAGVLKITSTTGSASGSDNTQLNALETQFDGTLSGGFIITARLKGPLDYINAQYQQAGIYFGKDQDNFVKFVAIYTGGKQVIQFKDELGGSSTATLPSAVQNVSIGSFSSITTLDLRLVGDSSTGKISAYYAINGGSFTKLSSDLTLSGTNRTNFFNATSRAGLMTNHKSAATAITTAYDSFTIQQGTPAADRPTVTDIRPRNGAVAVSRDAFIAVDVNLPTPGKGVDSSTLAGNVILYRTSDHMIIPGVTNTSGGGDAIVFTPTQLLDANTQYTFEITDGVKDTGGASFVPYSASFTTGTGGGTTNTQWAFEKITLTAAQGESYTCVDVGPDGKLYASTIDGLIQRFNINADGTLGTATTITTIQTNNGGPRMVTGFAFDPASTAANVILWVNHGQYAFEGATDWTGKLSKLSGSSLGTYQDMVTGLPRSVRDHLNNQPVFGPDGKLYFQQASSTAMGSPDNAWGQRAEHLLTAAILVLDPSKLTSTPLDVRTEAVATPYDPFATNAPLKIYASGVRNAYDLLWHSNGKLYAPTNGSASGGATPASPNPAISSSRIDQSIYGTYNGPVVPGISKVTQTEHDWLFSIQQNGYYGHPNPTRFEWVMNGGNPTSGTDAYEVAQYPVGTLPDRNYRGVAFDFGQNYSPNGVVEYTGSAFGNALKGKILVVRYSGGDDIMVLSTDASGNITGAETGIAGFKGFVDPVDLTEHNGNIYVAEYGGQKITLLRPIAPGANIVTNKTSFYFDDVHSGASGGSGSSPFQTIKITNTGTSALALPSDGLSITGANASQFTFVNPGLPLTIQPGESVNLQVAFAATSLGIKNATLVIKSNDADAPTVNITLRGVGTAGEGGNLEPSLQRVMDLFQIPINVGDNDSSTTDFPIPPVSGNDEVTMPRLQKAGGGEVTIELLGVFANSKSPAIKFGYYSPGTPEKKTQLFTVAQSEAQAVSPTAIGNTSFDPGTDTFSIYGVFPAFTNREVYSEDALNTWESNSSNRRKVRFYPLKNADGSTVPNAYVFAFEEYTVSFDQNDIVGIIRNVKAAPAGAEIGLQNMDGGPFADRLIFNRIQNLDTLLPNKVHDQSTLRIKNTGSAALDLTNLTLTGAFQFISGGSPTSIAPGAYADVVIKFTGSGQDVTNGSLSISSNDPDEPTTIVELVGWWQSYSEDNPQGQTQEPTLKELLQVFGYKVNATNTGQSLNTSGSIVKVGEEVLSPYWYRADANAPVNVRLIAAFHQQARIDAITGLLTNNASNIKWYYEGATTETFLFKHNNTEGQSFYPHLENSTTNYAQANFSPNTNAFGFKVDSRYSDPAKNPLDNAVPNTGHAMRWYIAKDRNGKIIPDTYILAQDYTGLSYSNYDYQDNLYLVTNVRPKNPPSQVIGAAASGSSAGNVLNWTKNTEGNVGGYRVYRSSSSGGPWTLLNADLIASNTYTDATAPVGVQQFYRVTAVDVHGGESTPVMVNAMRPAVGNTPSAPTNLDKISVTVSQVVLTWTDNASNETGYKLERRTGSGSYQVIASLGQNAATYTDTSVSEGTTYTYRVFAYNASGNSGTSNEVIAATPATQPLAPSGLSAAQSIGGIQLTWSDNSGNETGFIVQRKTGSGGTWADIATTGANVSGYTDTNVTAGLTYFYRVRSTNSAGDSGNSNEDSAIAPQPAAMQSADIGGVTPSGNTNIITDGTDYDITAGGANVWGTADQFRYVYRQVSGNFDVKVLVSALQNNDPKAKAGIMARASLDANAANAYARLNPIASNGPRFSYRTAAGGSTTAVGSGTGTAPMWLRLKREGSTFTAYVSTDGSSWTTMGTQSISMGTTIYLGLATCANTAGQTTTAQYRNFSDTSASVASPNAPSGLVAAAASNKISLSWNDNATNETTQRIERRTASGSYASLATVGTNVSSYDDTTAQPGVTYFYRVIAINNGVESAASNEANAMIPGQPSAMTSIDIGTTPGGSTSVLTEGVDFDITAGGANVWGTSDQFRYVYEQVTGDFDVKVQVTSLELNDEKAKAGIMARESLASNAANAYARMNPIAGNGPRFSYRTTTGGTTAAVGSGTGTAPMWLRLKRVGNTFTAYLSSNGSDWTQMASQTIAMGSTIYLGLATCSNVAGETTTASYRNYGDTNSGSTPTVNAPSGLSAIADADSIDLVWTDNANNETSQRIERRTSGGLYTTLTTVGAGITSYSDTTAQSGVQYFYRVIAVSNGTDSGASNEATATIGTAAFTSTNIGNPSPAGSTVKLSDSSYDITGGGADVWNASDQFRFVHKQLTGDFDVKVRVADISATDPAAFAGIMARADLNTNSRYVMVKARDNNTHRMSYRSSTGGNAVGTGTGAATFPNAWVRMVRVGNTFTTYISTNGADWTQFGQITISMPATMYVGMAVCAHANGTAATALFRDLSGL